MHGNVTLAQFTIASDEYHRLFDVENAAHAASNDQREFLIRVPVATSVPVEMWEGRDYDLRWCAWEGSYSVDESTIDIFLLSVPDLKRQLSAFAASSSGYLHVL